MSDRIGGYIRPGYDPIQVPSPPTLDSASITGEAAFTASSDTGGGSVTQFTVIAVNDSSGAVSTATGTSSPIAISGLTIGVSYTFSVIAENAFGPSGSSNTIAVTIAAPEGQQAYTTEGSYSWTAPSGVTSISIVAIGGGGGSKSYGGGGGGAALGYKNNLTVSPGTSYTVVVGNDGPDEQVGEASYITVGGTNYGANGGGRAVSNTGGAGGTPLSGSSGGSGGAGGTGSRGGGGGAGGYSGNGGAGGGRDAQYAGYNGAGGGAGGGYAGSQDGGGGGGTGLLGEGSSGAGATTYSTPNSYTYGAGGGGGSGGGDGKGAGGSSPSGDGAYGGGMGSGGNGGTNAHGAVRIIWPGTTRSFPSTNTGDV